MSGNLLFPDPRLADQITHVEELMPRVAKFRKPESPMHASVESALLAFGATQLYSHQALAYDAAMRGEDVVVTTGTNSGKTLCYNVPAMQFCMTEPACRCLYLFPTKALAQDQMSKLEQLMPTGIRVGCYDGDTPQSQRSPLRKLGHIILTNPDMLHLGILPSHENWTKFLKSLRLIVIDEMHTYRGVFGSNVASVLRRLLRLCQWHHNRPQIIACSATIGNPEELFRNLTGRTATLVNDDGSPSGKRSFVFFNPPLLGTGNRLSSNIAASEIFANLVECDQKTLVFSRSRVGAELVLKYARRRLSKDEQVDPLRIESYRAGYTPKERREIEKAIFKGKLLGLSATSAMELGVDIGTLDGVVINGYPGTTSSFWQQAGRAGRGTRDSLALFVAKDDPLEQFIVRQPAIVLRARNEDVSINPENKQILSKQLLCAAQERPISPTELTRFGTSALSIAEELDRSGELKFSAGLFFYPGADSPAARVSIRGAGDQIRLLVGGEELGTMDYGRAFTQAHEGAIYLHRGNTFVVKHLDLNMKIAQLEPITCDYYTLAQGTSVIQQRVEITKGPGVSLVGVTVTDQVQLYKRMAQDGDTVLGVEPLDLPAQTFETIAVRIDFPELNLEADVMSQMGAVHGAEHALLSVAPLLAACDRGDLGHGWYATFPDTMAPAVFVYDATPGGVGLCEKLAEVALEWVQSALKLLTSCECEIGCPACLYSTQCESENEVLNKGGAIELLDQLIRRFDSTNLTT